MVGLVGVVVGVLQCQRMHGCGGGHGVDAWGVGGGLGVFAWAAALFG